MSDVWFGTTPLFPTLQKNDICKLDWALDFFKLRFCYPVEIIGDLTEKQL